MGDQPTGEQAPPQAAPPPAWQPPYGSRPRLERSRSDRKIAGVAGGLGAQLGIEPLWLRIGFVVLAFAGGLGILLYLAGWALIPEEGESAALGDGVLEKLRRAPSWLPVLLFVLAGLVFFTKVWGGAFFWAVALVVAGVWLYHNDAHRHAPPASPAGPGAPVASPPNPAAGAPPAWPASPAPPAQFAAGSYPQPYAQSYTGSAYAPPRYPARPPYAPPAAGPARPPRPPSYLGRYTLAALLVILGTTAAVDNIGGWHVPARTYPALALLVVGAGLLVGAVWGRGRWLIFLGLPILLLALAFSIVKVPLRDGAGQRQFAPNSILGIRPEYTLSAGQIHLDLSQVPWGTETARTRLRLAFGEIDLIVPSNVQVQFRGHTGAGEIDLPFLRRNGTDVTLQTVLPTDQPVPGPTPTLIVNAEVSLGHIQVTRSAVPATGPTTVVPTPAPAPAPAPVTATAG